MTQSPYTSLLDLSRVQPEHDAAVTEYELFWMFIHILRDRSLLGDACRELREDAFDQGREPHWRLFWGIVLQYVQQYRDVHIPTLRRQVATSYELHRAQYPGLTWGVLLGNDQNGVLWQCETYPQANLNPAWARDLLIRFLQQRAGIKPLRTYLDSPGNVYPHDIAGLINLAQADFRRFEGLRMAPIGAPMPAFGSPLPPPDVFIPTCIPYLDRFIVGQRAGDCNGVLGVYASGKTTLAIDMSVTQARNFSRAAIGGGCRKISVLVTYEESARRINPRVWANAARIPHRKLANFDNWNHLTTQDNPDPYEQNLRQEDPGALLGERARWIATHRWLDSSFLLLDMSGSDQYPNCGTGYVDEIVTYLERVCSERNVGIGAVHIDYAKIMCMRHMQSKNINEDKIRHYVGQLGDRLRREVAEHFGCPVWLFHQIAAAENRRPSTTPLHHSDASESKAFAENMAVCVCLGVKDQETGCIQLALSKIRYQPNVGRQWPVLQIDGDFCRLVEVSDFVPDALTRTFVDPETRHQIVGDGRNGAFPRPHHHTEF